MNEIGFVLQAEKGIPGGIPTLNTSGIIENVHLPPTQVLPQAETDEEILIGQPVYLKQNGHLALARCTDYPRARVCGVAVENKVDGFSCSYIFNGIVQRDNWNLRPGLIYYLDSVLGEITTDSPENQGYYVVAIGMALTTSILSVQIQPSILL